MAGSQGMDQAGWYGDTRTDVGKGAVFFGPFAFERLFTWVAVERCSAWTTPKTPVKPT